MVNELSKQISSRGRPELLECARCVHSICDIPNGYEFQVEFHE